MFKHTLLMAAVITFMSSAYAKTSDTVTGLKNPESALTGPDGRVYVSEIGEFDKDGDGKITVIDKDGKAQDFVSGLDDPKGLAVSGKHIFVTDKKRVLKVDKDGKWTVFAAADAFPVAPQFLNDLEADAQGNIYVSDSGDTEGKGGAVYRIDKNGKVTLITNSEQDAQIQSPNGLLVDGKDSLLELDLLSGTLYRIKIKTGKLEKVAEGFGGGDGIVRGAKGVLYASDWKNGSVFTVSKKGEVKLLKNGFKSAADIGLSGDGKFILVPDMLAGELVWLPIK
ncbi:MAG: SMP-30/gluconolactonase/LRE family protein [Methylococcaceae bacterium]|nr:SMP-30/gluconolactonase/LRE family protein [Methylococcaceae bacterium]MDZ4155153.1 SMP-30/gluconolactonase/LRE family protein [Methylococcales bacterium]MDP2394403.1 SMP-30/gluconolactonase/LRE family protein [Methylococcaceae bacterium]MDP3021446.1 SMP-30/gluconolactonase/LRE family protein [Methylococcaceae bacterium]MDP3388580.1 SMP-30/gluconolactonase/LRE family protein [Methylococcaceae bacterium]